MSATTILVFSERSDLMKELVGAARGQAAAKVVAVGLGDDISALTTLGEDVIYHVNTDVRNPTLVTAALAAVISEVQPTAVLIGATKVGLEVAPRVAERMGAGYAAWVLNFQVDGSASLCAKSMLYAGTGLVTYQFKRGPVVLSIAAGVFAEATAETKTANVRVLELRAEAPCLNIVDYRPKQASRERLEAARMVVDVGQGVKQREDLAIIERLADTLDGQVACSRPISSDRDWFPEWVGLSGKKIKPELCLTVGVSGAIQHVVGIRESHLIAAVNTDEGAPIFGQADYGVVADLYEFLPVLMDRLKARGLRASWML